MLAWRQLAMLFGYYWTKQQWLASLSTPTSIESNSYLHLPPAAALMLAGLHTPLAAAMSEAVAGKGCKRPVQAYLARLCVVWTHTPVLHSDRDVDNSFDIWALPHAIGLLHCT